VDDVALPYSVHKHACPSYIFGLGRGLRKVIDNELTVGAADRHPVQWAGFLARTEIALVHFPGFVLLVAIEAYRGGHGLAFREPAAGTTCRPEYRTDF
jgi:hypothetical protein